METLLTIIFCLLLAFFIISCAFAKKQPEVTESEIKGTVVFSDASSSIVRVEDTLYYLEKHYPLWENVGLPAKNQNENNPPKQTPVEKYVVDRCSKQEVVIIDRINPRILLCATVNGNIFVECTISQQERYSHHIDLSILHEIWDENSVLGYIRDKKAVLVLPVSKDETTTFLFDTLSEPLSSEKEIV